MGRKKRIFSILIHSPDSSQQSGLSQAKVPQGLSQNWHGPGYSGHLITFLGILAENQTGSRIAGTQTSVLCRCITIRGLTHCAMILNSVLTLFQQIFNKLLQMFKVGRQYWKQN